MGLMIDSKPEYNAGEQKVWNSFSKNLPDDYIVYFNRETKGREYDFCVLIPDKGLIIVEVKGWTKNSVKVNSSDSVEILSSHEFVSSPKKQARMYRFNLLNEIKELFNSSPLIMDVVCYPFITKDDFMSMKLNVISDLEYTILAEEIENSDQLINKINNVIESNLSIPHTPLSKDLYNLIRSKYEPSYIVEEKVDSLHYSSLYCFNKKINSKKCEDIIKNYFAGTKMIIFASSKSDIKLFSELIKKRFKNENIDFTKGKMKIGNEDIFGDTEENFKIFNFEIYLMDKEYNDGIDFEIHDGLVSTIYLSYLQELQRDVGFNCQQYLLEHSDREKNILVKAGAGTGKTYSMISRISYLCLNNKNPLLNLSKDLVMVTFTNDAANVMKERLKQNFINYFVLTKNKKYLRLIEEVNISCISTIHKFALELLRNSSSQTGLSIDFDLSSNEFVRDQLYSELLDNFYSSKEENLNIPVPVYEIKNKLIQIANKLLQKSIDLESIDKAELGQSVDDNIPYFVDLISNVLIPAEKEYSNFLKDEDLLELKDCLILLNKILKSNYKFSSYDFKYIFIDEFQDSATCSATNQYC